MAKGSSEVKADPVLAVKWCEPTHRFRSATTGQIVPAFCRAWRCGRCGPKKARRVMSVAHHAGCTRFLTLTMVGEHWQQRRARMKQLVFDLHGQGHDVDIVWCVEPNPGENGHHVHGLTGGAYVDQDVWSDTANACGMGEIVDIRRAETDAAGHYAVKAGLYSTKGCAGGPDAYGAWLGHGGGRGVHWTRRAFGGQTFPAAYAAFCAARGFAGSDPGPWVREPIPAAQRTPSAGYGAFEPKTGEEWALCEPLWADPVAG